MLVHPTAIVSPKAEIADDVEIGPYSCVGENVRIGRGTRIGSYVVIEGWTTIGEENHISHGAVIGAQPQDFRYKGEESYVRIGDRNSIREFVTVHRGAEPGGETIIGDENMIMATVHVAHNCVLENNIVMANLSTMAGHVHIESQAVVGGMAGLHQFIRVGRMAMVGGFSKVIKDIPPFSIVDGQPARIYGINSRGMVRRGVSKEARLEIKKAYHIICNKGLTLSQALEEIRTSLTPGPEVEHLVRFMEGTSKMGVLIKSCRQPGKRGVRDVGSEELEFS